MIGSRQVLAKEVLFYLRGPGYPQDDAIPNFFPDCESSLLGLSNNVSFVNKLFSKWWKLRKEKVHYTTERKQLREIVLFWN